MYQADEVKILLKALAFAAHKHKNQRRKDIEAQPYINHPIALASVLCHEAVVLDIEVICGALLHDTVEDTDTTPEEIDAQFGATVRQIVMDVTDDTALPREVRKQLQVEHAVQACEKAKLVKIADKICNLRDMVDRPPADWSLGRKQEYFDWAKAVVDGLRGAHGTLERLFDEAYARRPR